MKVYQISYDLRNQRNYPALYEKIKSYGTYAHALESSWVIVTSQSAEQVRDSILSVMDSNDELLVTRLQGEAAWQNLTSELTHWLKSELNRAA